MDDLYNETDEVYLDEELYLMGVEEPMNYSQVVKDSWKITIGLKWIFKLKKDAQGNIIIYKARLVAKGYVQEHGVDFDEVFAPVTRLETVRLLLALAAKCEWEVHHLDVKTAFLNGDISEDVYVVQPEGFVKEGKEHMVCKLIKALYGLHQAPRAWYLKLNLYLESLGFKKCPSEHAVYTRKEGEEKLVVAVYVDDLLVTGSNVRSIEKFKRETSQQFEMTNMGKLSYFLGIEVQERKGCI